MATKKDVFGGVLTGFELNEIINTYFLSFLFLIFFTITIANNTTAIKRSGPVHTYKPNGISITRFKRFIMLPINKQIDAISCTMLVFFIVYSPLRY